MTEHEIRRKSIYLLPNAFTTAALFAGFFAIVQSMQGNSFQIAAIAIFVAMVLDGMDGRVARLTNTQSAFGEQYDSLSDMVSFGVAPALLMYAWVLKPLGKFGWLAAFIYVAGAALRLARFNVNVSVVDKRFFQGLPSPSAAALIAGFVWVISDQQNEVQELWIRWSAFAITIFAGVSMVSNVPFYSGKSLGFKKAVPFGSMFLVILVFVAVSVNPPIVLFGLFVLYAVSGYLMWVFRCYKTARLKAYKRQRRADKVPDSNDTA